MTVISRIAIERTLIRIESEYRSVFEELRNLPIPGETAIDVGCSSGYEAIAMQWFLQVETVVGVDKDLTGVDQFSKVLRDDLSSSGDAVGFAHVPQSDRDWWFSEVPQFLRQGHFPSFEKVDLANTGALVETIEPGSCGFGYCSNVLCHIHDDQGPDAVQLALSQIMEVLRADAWFVAQEPSDQSFAYFHDVLEEIAVDVQVNGVEFKTEYRARRSS